jgi:lysophospholipase L1-like esterase
MAPRPRRLAILGAKLLFSLLLTAGGLEIGTRLIMPAKQFGLIPNTFDPVCRIRQMADADGFIRCPEYEMEIHTNAGGLREARDFTHARTDGKQRVLCLGDSFTNGLGVHGHETFAKVAEQALEPDFEVLNAGVSATGTAEQLAWFELEGRLYQPDLVVLAFCVNDWTDNAKGGLFTLDSDSTLVQHPAVEGRSLHWLRKLRALPGYNTWFARSHFLNRFRQWYAQRHHGKLEAEAAGNELATNVWGRERALAEALLRELRAAAERNGSEFLVMPVPAQPGSGKPERQEAELAAFLDREGFDWLDLREEIRRHPNPVGGLYYPVDGHWTAAGHALAGRRLAARITENHGGR